MRTFDLLVPCHFGLEAVLKREIYDLGYEITKVEDGRVTFEGDEEAICRANIFLRTAERVMIQVGRFKATTFEELFQGIKNLPWDEYIPEDGKFWVKKASSINSKLFSPSDIQSIAKKAMVERMKQKYHKEWFKEDGAAYPVRIFLLKDEVTVALDTSGDSLHKRGYRTMTSKAPLTETLAASLIMLTPWRKDRILVDDPDAAPIWPRYSELSDNRPFFATREGVKVYDLREVPAERRVGYSWYGTWGGKVLKKYPEWHRKLGK